MGSYCENPVMPSRAKITVVISDTHFGSRLGLLPPGFVDTNGNPHGPNKMQEWMWTAWMRFRRELMEFVGTDTYEVVFNGDMIQGFNAKWANELIVGVGEQCRLVDMAMRPIVKGAKAVYFTLGTESHTGEHEHGMAEALGAVKPVDGWAWNDLYLDHNDTLCCFRHHGPTSAKPWTQTTRLGVAWVAEAIAAMESDERTPSVLCSAHAHTFGKWEGWNQLVVSSPAWQGPNRHAKKGVQHARLRVGAFALDWRGVKVGEIPTIRAFKFHPKSGVKHGAKA